MTKIVPKILLLLLLTATSPVFSQQGVPVADLNLSRDSETTRLDGFATFVEDAGGAMMLADAMRAHQEGKFSPLESTDLSQGVSGSAFWLRLAVRNVDSRNLQWVLSHDYGFAQIMNVYQIEPEQEVTGDGSRAITTELREDTPYSERPIRFRSFAVPFETKPGELDILYVRLGVNYANTQIIALRVAPRIVFDTWAAADRSFHFFFYGILFAFILIAGMVSVRAGSFMLALYSGYLVMSTLSWSELLGHFSEMLVPEQPHLSIVLADWTIFITGAMMFELGRRFLRLKSNWPRMDRFFLGLVALCGVGIVTAVIGLSTTSTVIMYILALMFGLFPLVVFYVWRRIGGYVLWFLIGLTLHSASVALLSIGALGFAGDPAPWYTISQVALVLEAAFLGLAMAERILERQRATERVELEWREAQKRGEIDSLTHLPNRRSFERKATEMLEEADSRDECHLVVIDIDEFELLNDRWGIKAGDRTLTELAHLLNSSLRVNDTAARYRGGSFAILLMGIGHDTCAAVIDRIRIKFNEHDTRMDNGTRVPHTVSTGLVTAGDRSVLELLEIADKALGVAKIEGYNTVVSEQRLGPRASGVSPAGLT